MNLYSQIGAMQQRPNEAHLKKCFTNYLNDNEIHLSSQEAIIFHTQKALLDASHPRHRSSLQMLRAILARDRNNTEFKEKTSADHTLAAIHKMQGLGISSKTISKIIESLYDIRLNYHNSMAKIQGLGRVKFDEIIFAESLLTEEKLMIDRRTHQTNIQQNIEQNTGGECSQLAITYREIFRHKKIASLIRKDIGEKLINIHIVGGHDRTYFTKPNAVHIFCRLIIDDTMFYIDPAL